MSGEAAVSGESAVPVQHLTSGKRLRPLRRHTNIFFLHEGPHSPTKLE